MSGRLRLRCEGSTLSYFVSDESESDFRELRSEGFVSDDVKWIRAAAITGGSKSPLTDVLELINLLGLPIEFAQQLDPYVRGKYAELWQQAKKRYVTLWRNKWLTADAHTLEDMIGALRAAAAVLESMLDDGVTLDAEAGGVGDDDAHLVTTDPEVAKKYDMLEESEFWGKEEDDDDEQTGIN
ncbi:MAG TPA: hypothetical protein VNH11_35150 [Pirellulales bacterium]|nr:hypothetical protein [Pirellulales bacterium]